VRDVAELSTERFNPARFGADRSFKYVEISDVDGEGYSVRAKDVPCAQAPSRARKRVCAGDLLVSTVRPERRTVGVVPAELDGAICSTGFAVLRCRGIQPLVLAHLLRHTFTTEQIVKENSGIAYPAIEEEKILDVVLPIDSSGLQAIFGVAEELDRARTLLREAENAFDHGLSTAVNVWMQK
jgi:type I restriction enzyme S subunit